jgi:hypothetical protein
VIKLTSSNARRLFEVASSQYGVFTTRQALDAGFAENTHTYHVHKGNWVRHLRGIYRLALFAASRDVDLMTFLLWSRDRRENAQGTFTHLTSLELHGLLDRVGSCHLTVPRKFRRSSNSPPGLVLHFRDLGHEIKTVVRRFPVTAVGIALTESVQEDLISVSVVGEVASLALARGLISAETVRVITEQSQMHLPFGDA